MNNQQLQEFWNNAPIEAWVWERFPNGKCVWHCRKGEESYDKKAPNFETEKNTLWRDIEKQKQADQIKDNLNNSLSGLNIALA